MATIINADTSDGLKLTSDTSGEIQFQSAGVVKAKVTSSGLQDANGSVYAAQPSFRNRVINGNMVIDQRNAGASVTATNGGYTLDRWYTASTASSKFTVDQDTDAPTGFSHSVKLTSSAATTPGSTDQYFYAQNIEGFNWADISYGTANAKTVTLSFWVKSSLTGTFGGSIQNNGYNYSYPFSYSISSANTWEQKSVTITGATAGTWIGATNGVGARLYFSLGNGSTYLGTANTWAASQYNSVTGETQVIGTSGATLYLTGVQLEIGSSATDFEFLPYDVQLARCERYFQKIDGGFGVGTASTNVQINVVMRVPMRTSPSATVTTLRITDMTTSDHTATSATISLGNITSTASRTNCGGFTGLTTSRPYTLLGSGTSAAPILFSAEL